MSIKKTKAHKFFYLSCILYSIFLFLATHSLQTLRLFSNVPENLKSYKSLLTFS